MNPSSSICYHCGKHPSNRHSVFCDKCLEATRRPLFFPAEKKGSTMPFTIVLYLVAIVVVGVLLSKALEVFLATP